MINFLEKSLSIYKIISILIIIISIYNNMLDSTVLCDSISEINPIENLPVSTEQQNDTEEQNDTDNENSTLPLLLSVKDKEKGLSHLTKVAKRKLAWRMLGNKDWQSYNEFKEDFDYHISLKRQIGIELRDFFKGPAKYLKKDRYSVLLNNEAIIRDNPNVTFFVQGEGEIPAAVLKNLYHKQQYTIHNGKFLKLNLGSSSNISTKEELV